jgi:hypothetical protein
MYIPAAQAEKVVFRSGGQRVDSQIKLAIGIEPLD